MHLKPHRWVVYVAHAVPDADAGSVDRDRDGSQLDLDSLPRNVSPIVCFDCGLAAPGDEHCPNPPRPGYPEGPAA